MTTAPLAFFRVRFGGRRTRPRQSLPAQTDYFLKNV